MAERYLAADVLTRAPTAANLYLVLLDPHGWMTYGAVGAWFLAINILALPGTRWPRPLSDIGIAGGMGYWLAVAGTVLRTDALGAIAAAQTLVSRNLACNLKGGKR
jgi:hypothetical protein